MSSCFPCSKKERRRGASPVSRSGGQRDSASTTSDLSDPSIPTIVSLSDLICPIADNWRRNHPRPLNDRADGQSRTSTNSTSSRLSAPSFLTPSPTRAGRSPVPDFEDCESSPPSPSVQRLRLALSPSPRASESSTLWSTRSAQRRLLFRSDETHSPESPFDSPQRQPTSQVAQKAPADRRFPAEISNPDGHTSMPTQQPLRPLDLSRMERSQMDRHLDKTRPSDSRAASSNSERPLAHSGIQVAQIPLAGQRIEAPSTSRAAKEIQGLGSASEPRVLGTSQSLPLPPNQTAARQPSPGRASSNLRHESSAQALRNATASSGSQASLSSPHSLPAKATSKKELHAEQESSLGRVATGQSFSSSPKSGRMRPLHTVPGSSPRYSVSPTASQGSPLGQTSILSMLSRPDASSRGALGAALALQKLQFPRADSSHQRSTAQHASPARQQPKTPQPKRSPASRLEATGEHTAAPRQAAAIPERPSGLSSNSFLLPTSLDVGGRTMNLRIEAELLISDKNEATRPKMSEFVRSFAHAFNRDLGFTTSQMPPDLRELQFKGDYDKWYWKKTKVDRGPYSPFQMRLCSPLIKPYRDRSWRREIEAAWAFLEKGYKMRGSPSSHSHVNISLSGPFKTQDLKRIAQAAIHFKPALDQLMPGFNVDQSMQSLGLDNPLSNQEHKTASQILKAIDAIEDSASPKDLIRLVQQPNDENYDWDFACSLATEIKEISFRRPPACKTAQEVLGWVELAMSFGLAAIKCPFTADLQKITADVEGLRCFLAQASVEGVTDAERMQGLWAKAGRT